MGRSGGKRNSSSSSTTTAAVTASKSSRHTSTTNVTSSHSGCINAFFHFFDFHRFRRFPLHHHHPPPSEDLNKSQKPASLRRLQEQNVIKGLAAPRNSLESEPGEKEEENRSSSSTAPLSSSSRKDENLNFPPMGIQIKTRPKNHDFSDDGFSSEISVSPAIKTPTLVARLMGLDLLPDATHPPSSSSTPTSLHQHLQNLNPKKPLQIKHRNSVDGDLRGTRSLPDTPRTSAARRSDVDHHHRFSLQINKENMTPGEELILFRLANLKKKELKIEDGNRIPGNYARQIAKQVKDSVSWKVGMDITNTVRNREAAREELVNQFKAKKLNSKALARVPEEESSTIPSCSPRLRFLEPRNKPSPIPQKPPPLPQKPASLPYPEVQNQSKRAVQEEPPQMPNKKCKNTAGERFSPRPKKPVQEELFVRPSQEKKCKKTSLSNDLLNISVPTLLPVKKDQSTSSSSSVPKFSKKQVISEAQTSKQSSQLSSCLSLTYKHQGTNPNPHPHPTRCSIRSSTAVTATSATVLDGAEQEYIARILKRTGIDRNIPISFTRWFSPSSPLDPSIFFYLEHFSAASKHTTPLRHRCNRKLLFHLVDEILVEILKPVFNSRPWVCRNGAIESTNRMRGSELIEKLGSKIRSYPRADCQVLDDIDALIDRDLPDMAQLNTVAFEEEGEGIAAAIERDILDELLRETAFELRG